MDMSPFATRQEKLYYRNCINQNVYNSQDAMFDIYLTPNIEFILENNLFRNLSGPYGATYAYNSGPITMTNTTFID